MKNINTLRAKVTLALTSAMFALMAAVANPAAALTVFAASATGEQSSNSNMFDSVSDPIIGLINQVTFVLIPLVAAVGTIYCILLGVNFAKAEEPQEREKSKAHLRNAIIGFVLIFVLIVALNRLTPIMTRWMSTNAK